jgi:ketopantoate reductase
MEMLFVGAGAVGQVLAAHAQRGGARVSFFVRPKYAEATAGGFVLHPRPERAPLSLRPDGVLTTADEVAARRFDYIILCTSSPALRQGTWLDELAAASGDAALAGIQPGLDDATQVAARVGEARTVWGAFPIMSWDARAIDGDGAGMAYWRAPLVKLPFSGARARPLVETLTRGGLPCRSVREVRTQHAFGGTLLDLHVAALECAGWRFAALRRDRALLAELHAALREALAIAARHVGAPLPLPLRLVGPLATRAILWLMPKLAPLDLDAYFRVHFGKVADQGVAMRADLIARGERFGLPTAALRHLDARVPQARGAA